MNLPDLAKPWPIRLAWSPDFSSPHEDDAKPADGDESWDPNKNVPDERPTGRPIFQRPLLCINERSPEEEGFCGGSPTT